MAGIRRIEGPAGSAREPSESKLSLGRLAFLCRFEQFCGLRLGCRGDVVIEDVSFSTVELEVDNEPEETRAYGKRC